jgi:hypothetical protein
VTNEKLLEKNFMDADSWPFPHKTLKYEKGENRLKHLGKTTDAQMVQGEGGHWVGKCPKGFSLENAQILLQCGIPEFRKTTAEKPYRIWAYFNGAIYAARSQDGGNTWHGFPSGYPMKEPPSQIMRQLMQQAREKGEEANIQEWLDKRWNAKK